MTVVKLHKRISDGKYVDTEGNLYKVSNLPWYIGSFYVDIDSPSITVTDSNLINLVMRRMLLVAGIITIAEYFFGQFVQIAGILGACLIAIRYEQLNLLYSSKERVSIERI